MAQETGRIRRAQYKIDEIEWSIDDYFTVPANEIFLFYRSPTFSFAEAGGTWHLRYFPRRNECKREFVGLHLYRNSFLQKVEYTLGLRKSDGSVVQMFKGTMEKSASCAPLYSFDLIKKKELLHRKHELVPNNTLTIICTIKFIANETLPSQNTVTDEISISKLTRLDKLSENFKDLFSDKETCDVTLRVQDKEYKAHKSILLARSKVFAATFKHDTLESQTGVINVSDCDPDSFQKFLEYLYSGELQQLCNHSAMHLYYTSDKYDVEELKVFCVEYLMQHLTVENVCDIASLADTHEEKKLLSVVQDYFNKNVRKIFLTPEWESFLKNEHRLASKLLIKMANVKLAD